MSLFTELMHVICTGIFPCGRGRHCPYFTEKKLNLRKGSIVSTAVFIKHLQRVQACAEVFDALSHGNLMTVPLPLSLSPACTLPQLPNGLKSDHSLPPSPRLGDALP